MVSMARKGPKTERKPISEANRELWLAYLGPMRLAAAQFQAAVNATEQVLGALILEREGCPVSQGWRFDPVAMEAVRAVGE
jgi:hypothetical protein